VSRCQAQAIKGENMQHKVRFVLAASVLAAAAVAQGSVPATVPAVMFQQEGKRGGVFTQTITTAPVTFNYYNAIDGATQTVLNNVFDRLLTLNPYTNKIYPSLVESWQFSEDGLTLTMRLRDIKWSDGTPLTADDVVFTVDSLANNAGLRANFTAQLRLGGQSLKFQKVNDRTFRVVMPVQYGAILNVLTFFPIMPKHKLEQFDPVGKPAEFARAWATDSRLADIPGTGPYVLSNYVANQKVTLARNPNSWRKDPQDNQLPYTDRLEYLVINSPEAQIAQLKAGTLDSLTITGAQFPDLKAAEVRDGKVRVVRGIGLNSPPWHWSFNFDSSDVNLQKAFRDIRFRQAMNNALNRERIIESVFNGLASLPGHGVAPISDWYFNTRQYFPNWNLKAAGEALDAMGLKDTDNDGVRNLSPTKQFEFSLTHAADSSVAPAMAAIIQNDLKQIGVRVNLRGVAGNTILATGQAGNFDSILLTFGDQPDPQLRKDIWQPGRGLNYWRKSLQPAKAGDPINTKNMFPYERRIFQIFEEAERLGDQNRRKALYDEWQVLFAKHMPVILIAKPDVLAVANNRIGNFFARDNRVLWSTATVFEK
jgi:peptide/nickel transport system substrate-binding protein